MKQSCTFKPKINEMDPKICQPTPDMQKLIEKDQAKNQAKDLAKDKCLALFARSKNYKKKV